MEVLAGMLNVYSTRNRILMPGQYKGCNPDSCEETPAFSIAREKYYIN